MAKVPFDEIEIGMSRSYSQTITDADVKAFAGLSGDNNPVHMSDEYAEKSQFKKRIAHGMISSSFFSALFGKELPGEGCVYVNQNTKFLRPVYLNDTVTAEITVIRKDEVKRRVFFKTNCYVAGKRVIVGDAELYVPHDTE